MRAIVNRRLVDEAVAAYVSWREQCDAVEDAYRWWQAEPESGAAYDHYCRALENEEGAAIVYELLITGVGTRAAPKTGQTNPTRATRL